MQNDTNSRRSVVSEPSIVSEPAALSFARICSGAYNVQLAVEHEECQFAAMLLCD
jgi:hypothetical protein